MNFFDAQDRAKRATRLLVVAYLVATLIIVAGVTFVVALAVAGSSYTTAGPLNTDNTGLLVTVAIITATIIIGATLIKTAALSTGGSKVAIAMGGVPVHPDTQDPLRRRYRNVVEEMSIASGVATPEIFILEEESGINAFAAGYTTNDAAIAVTRGTLERLNRDELQGVVAHEFSHILNGDMRLNIRMMGVLYGIMVIGLLGRIILRGSRYGALSSRRSKNAPAFLIIGLGLAVLGGIGVLIARIVKAAVSRQRESLADAAAVQFTRQTSGIANALKKIGGFSDSSYLTAKDPEEVSHMLFGEGAKLASVFATHPPLVERIQALEPGFDASQFPNVDAQARQRASAGVDEGVSGFADATPGTGVPTPVSGTVGSATADAIMPTPIIETVGRPTPEHVEIAQNIRESMPKSLYAAAHSTNDSYLLTIAMVIDEHDEGRQMALVAERLGRDRADRVKELADEMQAAGRHVRLPLLEITFPALKQRPLPQLEYLVDLLSRLIAMDGKTSLFEYCFYAIVINGLDQSLDPTAKPRPSKLSRKAVRGAVLDLLRILSRNGTDDDAAAEAAFAAGIAVLPNWARDATLGAPHDDEAATLDLSLKLLNALNNDGKELLIRSLSATVKEDRKTTSVEAELLRTVCAALNCPLPPVASAHRQS